MNLTQYGCGHLGAMVEGRPEHDRSGGKRAGVIAFIRWSRPGRNDTTIKVPDVCPECKRAGR